MILYKTRDSGVAIMEEKLPYYMAYPMPALFGEDRFDRRDLEYMRSFYPALSRKLLSCVQEECDRIDHPCSVIYDEYPDRLQVRLLQKRITGKVMADYEEYEKSGTGESWRDKEEPERESGELQELITLLLCEEICRRRRERRKRVLIPNKM